MIIFNKTKSQSHWKSCIYFVCALGLSSMGRSHAADPVAKDWRQEQQTARAALLQSAEELLKTLTFDGKKWESGLKDTKEENCLAAYKKICDFLNPDGRCMLLPRHIPLLLREVSYGYVMETKCNGQRKEIPAAWKDGKKEAILESLALALYMREVVEQFHKIPMKKINAERQKNKYKKHTRMERILASKPVRWVLPNLNELSQARETLAVLDRIINSLTEMNIAMNEKLNSQAKSIHLSGTPIGTCTLSEREFKYWANKHILKELKGKSQEIPARTFFQRNFLDWLGLNVKSAVFFLAIVTLSVYGFFFLQDTSDEEEKEEEDDDEEEDAPEHH